MTGSLRELKRTGYETHIAVQRSERHFSTTTSRHSFFPQTIRDWNDLPDSLITSAEMLDDCMSKFTSLVRAKD